MPRFVAFLRTTPPDPKIVSMLTTRGYGCLDEPILKIDPLPIEDGEKFQEGQAVIITSIHALPALVFLADKRGAERDKITLYIVGHGVAEAALALGFSFFAGIYQTAGDLQAALIENPPKQPLLYLRGAAVRYDLKGNLGGQFPHPFSQKIVYRAVPAGALSPPLLNAIDTATLEAVILFSPRGAENFARLVALHDRIGALSATKALCLASSMVKSLSVLPFSEIFVAKTPEKAAMTALIQGVLPPL